MADLDALCDMLDEVADEEEGDDEHKEEENRDDAHEQEPEKDDDVEAEEAELKAMLARVEAMKAKLAEKKQKKGQTTPSNSNKNLAEIDIFNNTTKNPEQNPKLRSPVKTNPFQDPFEASGSEKRKQIKLHQKTPEFGPALPVKNSRVITGNEKAELLKRINGVESVIKDLACSSDEDDPDSDPTRSALNEYGKSIKKRISKTQQNQGGYSQDQPVNKEVTSKLGFNKVTGSSLNLTSTSANRVLPKNMYTEKHSKIRIANPLVTQAQLDLSLISRKLIQMYRLKDAIVRSETSGDWVTIGVLYYKSTQTSKAGNRFTIWKMTDLNSGANADLRIITVMLFSRAHAVHYKMPLNKVVGILNPKVLEDRNGKGEVTLSVDHPDKIMELGDSLDCGKCQAKKADGSGCTNLVNLSNCEYCHYHVKKAYKALSSKRGDLQSSFSGGMDVRARIMSKIAPKGEVFAGGQILNQLPGKASAKEKAKDSVALKALGVVTVAPPEMSRLKQSDATKLKLLEKSEKLDHLSDLEKEAMRKVLNKGVSEELGEKLLVPSPGSRIFLKHLTKEKEVVKDGGSKEEIVTKLSAKDLLLEHKKKLIEEEKARKMIEARKQIALQNISAVPQLGRGLDSGGFIDLSPRVKKKSDVSKAKAIEVLKGKAIAKQDPNNSARKRKKKSEEEIENSRKRIALKIDEKKEEKKEDEEKKVFRGFDGKAVDEKRLEELKKLKSKNMDLAEEHELEMEERYFDLLEKKDAMEEQMISTKEIEAKVVTCKACNYTAFTQSDLCKEKGHRVKFIKALKRFFECEKCKRRTVSLDKYPKRTCGNCGGSSWKRTGMMRERKGPLLESEKLLIRGQEQKFVGASISSNQLNLDAIP